MNKQKVLIFIVSYNHQLTITKVMNRLPEELFTDGRYATEVLIIDDCSPDKTFEVGHDFIKSYEKCPVKILKNPKNLGYGGNQKVGYQYAIENNFDHVVLLHGDGQYAPEVLPELLVPLVEGNADAVYGSRMIKPEDALKGGMPRYKFYGNKVLTKLENFIAQSNLTEWHSGLRLYSVEALKKVPFHYNSDYYDFDTDIILQFVGSKLRIAEIPIPTHYGDEVCNVDGLKYARKIIASCLLYRVQRWGIFYHPRFNFASDAEAPYESKHLFPSSHQTALEFAQARQRALLISVEVTKFEAALSDRGVEVERIGPDELSAESLEQFLDHQKPYNLVLALEALEHTDSPERMLHIMRHHAATRDAQFLFTAGNVGFLPVRIMLLLGKFNYGVRGILDRNHRRLFTLSSLRSLLNRHGFELHSAKGIPAPFPLAFGKGFFGANLLLLNRLGISLSRRVFAYQLAVTATAKPTSEVLLQRALSNTQEQIERINQEVLH
jgi:glycosyltransferase involved in cell wall biosynthesis